MLVCTRHILLFYHSFNTFRILGSDGKKATAQITDRCEGCNITSIDLTRDLFKQLGDLSAGRIHGVTWKIEPTRFPVT